MMRSQPAKVEGSSPVNPKLWKIHGLISIQIIVFHLVVSSSGWWLVHQPIWKNIPPSNLDHLSPGIRDEHKKCVSCHHLGWLYSTYSLINYWLSLLVNTSYDQSTYFPHHLPNLKFEKKGSFQAAHPRKQKWSMEKTTIWWIYTPEI